MKTYMIAPTGSICRAVLALALAGSCAFAQSVSPSPALQEVELAPVTVSAHDGVAVPYDCTGVSVSVLDVELLKKEGVYSLSEALTTVPGVYVLPGGGKFQRGNVSDVVIRGMSSQKYVMPMMDGMRLGGGMSSSNGLIVNGFVSRAPIFGLGTLELVRGAQGSVYGSGAMSGVLFMETPEGKGDPSLSLFNEYGSFDSYTANATAQGRVRNTAFFVSSTYERTNNNPRFADGGKPSLKHAGKHENYSQAVRLDQYVNTRNQFTLTYRREDSAYRSYSPASAWGAASVTPYEFTTDLVTLRWQSHVSDPFSTGLMVGYFGSSSDLGSGYVQDLDNIQLEWRNSYKWNDRHKTTGGLAWARTDFTTKSGSVKQSDSSSLDSVLSLFAEHSVQPVKNWNNTLALRLDESNVYAALFTLRASSNFKFNRERSRLFASAGRGYSAPSSFQRSRLEYDSGWGVYHGNPNLHCETNWSADLGAEHEVAKDHFLSATLFWIRTEDGIKASPVTDPESWRTDYFFTNAPGHWTTQGVELALRGTWEKSCNTGYTLSYTLAQPKEADGSQVAGSARQVWAADVHTSPVKGLTTGLGLSAAVGRRGYIGSRLDNFLTLRWYANYQVNERLSFHLRVENLTNQKFELDEDWTGSPANTWINPGTAVYAGCTVKF